MRSIIVASIIVVSSFGYVVASCSKEPSEPVWSEPEQKKGLASLGDSGAEETGDQGNVVDFQRAFSKERGIAPDGVAFENRTEARALPERRNEQTNGGESKERTTEAFQRAPRITNISPFAVCSEVKTKVQVLGQFFTKDSQIYVGTKKFTTVFRSSTLLEAGITIYTPNQEFDLTVKNAGRVASNGWKIIALEDLPPTLQSLTPEKVKHTEVTYLSVQGKQFPSSPTIMIGNKSFPTRRISRSELTTQTPVDFRKFQVGAHKVWIRYSGCIGKSNPLLLHVGP
ncbi:MAG: hypothetical protein EP343_28615 [Deltaproteobacteria bacterium]|nr:MAG: hypothetical protein EP343_28615 [Deltaproteobacteria bacterium]